MTSDLTERRAELARIRGVVDQSLAKRAEVEGIAGPMIEFLEGASPLLTSLGLDAYQPRMKRAFDRHKRRHVRFVVPPLSGIEMGVAVETVESNRQYDDVRAALMEVVTQRETEEVTEEIYLFDLFWTTRYLAAALEDRQIATPARLRAVCAATDEWLTALRAARETESNIDEA